MNELKRKFYPGSPQVLVSRGYSYEKNQPFLYIKIEDGGNVLIIEKFVSDEETVDFLIEISDPLKLAFIYKRAKGLNFFRALHFHFHVVELANKAAKCQN